MTFCLATRKSDGCVGANDPAFHSPHPEPWDMRNPGSYSVQTEAPKSQRSGVAVQVKNRTHTPLPGEADRLGEIVNKEHGFGNAERSPVGGVGLEEIPEETGFPPGAFHQPESENQQVSRTPRTAILKPRADGCSERHGAGIGVDAARYLRRQVRSQQVLREAETQRNDSRHALPRGARQNRVPIQPADIDEPVQIADPGQRVPTMFHFEALLSVSGGRFDPSKSCARQRPSETIRDMRCRVARDRIASQSSRQTSMSRSRSQTPASESQPCFAPCTHR